MKALRCRTLVRGSIALGTVVGLATAALPIGSAGAVGDEKAADIGAAVRALVHDPVFEGAQVAVAVLDVDSGRYLAAANEHVAQNPASNTKLYTAAAALALLHADFRYETTLNGSVKDGVVRGPLVLRGHGDPSLTSADLWQMVQELRAQGARRVEGDIVVDQRFFDGQTTPPAFDQHPDEWAPFRAPVSSIAVNENTMVLSVHPSRVGEPALVSFEPPGFVDVEGAVTTSSSGADSVKLELRANGKRVVARLSGQIGEDGRVVRYTRRVEDPSLLAGYTLRALLERAQIAVQGEVRAGDDAAAAVLARHQSSDLGVLLRALGKASDNFYAEMIFKSLAGEVKVRPATSADASELVTRWVDRIGANDTGVVIRNGSGLYDANRVTAASVVQLLRSAWRDASIQPEFVSHLAIGGVDGTLQNRLRDERTRRSVRAKTGTLDDAVALSGYVVGPPGRGPVAFSILFNNVAGKTAGARAGADTLVGLLARMQWRR